MANSRIEGKTWGIPFQRSTIVAYYNKDMFREAGLDPEAPPATWDEMVSMGKQADQGRHLGDHDPVDRLSLLDVPGAGDPERQGADVR